MAIYQEKTQMTQRPLTDAELEDARTAYNAIGKLYPATHAATELVAASDYLRRMMTERTTDGKPLRTERVPTKDMVNHSGSKYLHDVQLVGGKIDVYAVLVAFGVSCPARQHAIKKLLCAGLRGKGDELQDLRESVDAVRRAIEIKEAGE
jgi:hypothetical protein